MSCMSAVGMQMWRHAGAAVLLFGLGACSGEQGPPDLGPAMTTGSIQVSWDQINAEGDAVDCADLGVLDAFVALGGEPRILMCGDEQSVTFEGLLPQRYPVVIRLRGLAERTIPGGEQLDNVVAVGGETVEYNHTFEFGDNAGDLGAIRTSWTVEGQTPDRGCPIVGGHTVRVVSQPESIEPFEFDVPCADGERMQSNLRTGNYVIRYFLEDRDGNDLAVRQATTRVLRGATAEAGVDFLVQDRPPAAMYTSWTVTGSAAAEGCREDWTVRLRIAEDTQQNFTITTATAACDAGTYRFDELVAPRNPEFDRYQLSVFLDDPLRGQIDRQVQEDLQLFPSETTSVAVDLEPAP